jgi:acyl-homoserine lactone acylase PvdQ
LSLLVLPASAGAALGFRDILPAGQGQSVNSVGLGSYELTGTPPATFTNQEGMFERLLYDGPSLSAGDLLSDFKDGANSVVGPAASVEEPEPGVQITRDQFDVPHINASTRAGTMFGAGYAQAEDRLFEMDLLRHLGRSDLAEFLGPSYLPMDTAVWMQSDYDSAELGSQLGALPHLYGAAGAQALADENAYVAGINAYIASVRSNPLKLPGEYAALHTLPADWTPADSVAIAAEINQGFDLGGGGEVGDALLSEDLQSRLGVGRGHAAYEDIRALDDPAAPTTTDRRFTFVSTGRPRRAASAIPDPGSVQAVNPVIGAAASSSARGFDGRVRPPLLWSRLTHRGGDSFAYLISAKSSGVGHPVADMGPQLDFFSPEVVEEEDLHGPGINVRGAALPGALPVPIVGHTPSWAWSVTIGVGDHIDIFAERLCNPNGSPATLSSRSYLYHGHCIPFVVRDRSESTTPNALDSSPPEHFVLRTIRSIHGPIQSFGTVHGHPVAFSRADATYFHLADIGVYYDRLLSSSTMTPRKFIDAVALTPFSLNWFYIDSRNIAWTLSGTYPLRARGTSPDLPTWGTGRWDWKGFSPSSFTERALPGGRLPHVINPPQGYIANWNNKPAPGWRAASDDFYYSSAHRVQMVSSRIVHTLSHHGRIGPTRLTSIVEDVATADMRGERDLPWVLKVIGRVPRGPDASLLSILRSWVSSGAHRRDLRQVGYYDNSAAVALMDAWWPRLVGGIFKPALGPTAYNQAVQISSLDDPPNVDAEAWYNGWYGQVEQDLRDVLAGTRRTRVLGHFSRVYCGGSRTRNGSLRSCRRVLLATLNAAAAQVSNAQHTTDPSSWRVPDTCPVPASGPAPCDEIVFSPLGAVGTNPIPWQNRPTFQQIVEIGG